MNEVNVSGESNITLTEVTADSITINNNGNSEVIEKTLKGIMGLLDKLQVNQLQIADRMYNRNVLKPENLGYLLSQLSRRKLPEDITTYEANERRKWVETLKDAIEQFEGVEVEHEPTKIHQHYGWLIAAFLHKMSSPPGKENTLRSLSFMADAFYISIRQLCYIQVAHLLNREDLNPPQFVADFLKLRPDEQQHYDFVNLLLLTTAVIPKSEAFVPEIHDLVEHIKDPESELHDTILLLEKTRTMIANNRIEADDNLENTLKEYLSGLVYWLYKIAFLAKYRLVSVKEISIRNMLGTEKQFSHLFGVLHGKYNSFDRDYKTLKTDVFTYNKSVLLFKGTNLTTCMKELGEDKKVVISLSPLIVDESVFQREEKQTPEIYYYIGRERNAFIYKHYKAETPIEGEEENQGSYELLQVKEINEEQTKLNQLHRQTTKLF